MTRGDFEILIELYEHRVLTTPQIYELHFDTHTRASKRMLQLYRLGLAERFRPHTPTGSAPWHYTLDEPGARLVAARQEIDFKDFTFKKARIFDVAGSPRLRHRVECNGFFARLTLTCRRRGWDIEWIGERRATASWDSRITPDGIGRIQAGDRKISFFLEYDRGTESHEQLAIKTYRYRLIGRTVRSEDALLFVFPSAARERHARSALIGSSVPVATGVRAEVMRHPLEAVWLPLGDDRRRMILDLPRTPRDQPG
ncbi:MAG: replication-relaxation family protein [Actinomycetota bacterium]